jgi:hypothetical protein
MVALKASEISCGRGGAMGKGDGEGLRLSAQERWAGARRRLRLRPAGCHAPAPPRRGPPSPSPLQPPHLDLPPVDAAAAVRARDDAAQPPRLPEHLAELAAQARVRQERLGHEGVEEAVMRALRL